MPTRSAASAIQPTSLVPYNYIEFVTMMKNFMHHPLTASSGGFFGAGLGALFGSLVFGSLSILLPPIDELQNEPMSWLVLLLLIGIVSGSVVGAITGMLTIYGDASRPQAGCLGIIVVIAACILIPSDILLVVS